MILQLISPRKVKNFRTYVIRRLRSYADRLEEHEPKAVARAQEWDLTPTDLRAAATQLENEAADEDNKSNEQAFIPSSPLTCMLQSFTEEQAHKRGFLDQPEETQGLAESEVALTSVKVKEDKVDLLGLNGEEGVQGLSIGDMQDGEDIRYIVDGSLGVAIRLLTGRHKFNPNPAQTAALGEDARVMLFGDWATGLDRARNLAKVMAKHVINDAQTAPQRKQHLIHLGDTYYAGRSWEYERRFLPHWPDTEGKAATHWSLNGNHDMYAGGKGYFETLLQNDLFKSHRADPAAPESASSFFLLENSHWQIFGLDSAYDSPQLTGMNGAINEAQVKFMKEKVNPAKKVVLLTHHQLFSARASEGNSRQIRDKLNEVDVWKHIKAWIWGHEHRCVVYKQAWTEANYGLKFAMCLGNSGVPVKDEPVEHFDSVEWEYTDSFEFTDDKKLRYFAYACLEFDQAAPAQMKVAIYDWSGKPIKAIEI